MFRGFWVLLDNASLRHLAVGAIVALSLVAAFALFQRLTADPGQHPELWLTPAEQGQLHEAILSVAGNQRWAAGCLWDGDGRSIQNELDIPAGDRRLYAGSTTGGRAMSLVAVENLPPAGEFSAVERRGLFCLVPAGPSS